MLSPFERARIRRYFTVCLCNLSHFEMYWLPEPAPGRKSRGADTFAAPRRVVARAVSVERRFVLPAGAVRIGVYAHPFSGIDFLGDLDAVLAKLKVQRQREADDTDRLSAFA